MTMSYKEIIEQLKGSGNLRRIPEDTPSVNNLIDFSLNDYLGLAANTELQDEFFSNEKHRHIPMTSSAARLLASSQTAYQSLENKLAVLYSRPVLIFNSGYHANTGLISSLAEGKTLILADRLVHASMIDGIILSKSRFIRFRHNDTEHLRQLLEDNEEEFDRIIILVESYYSMDGDQAPLEEIISLKRSYRNTLLYVDEAHAFGVLGPNGLGLCKGSQYYNDIDIVVGTFGKAGASMGAFCAFADPLIREYIINRARSFIFSTAFPPMTAAWTEFMIDHIVEMDSQRKHLLHLGNLLSSDSDSSVPHHIFPVIIGNADKAVKLSEKLLETGLKVLPIRTPTVPPGTERLRISLSASMTSDDIFRLKNSLGSLL